MVNYVPTDRDFRVRIEGAEEAVVAGLAVDQILEDGGKSRLNVDDGTDHASWLCRTETGESRAFTLDENDGHLGADEKTCGVFIYLA